MPAADYPDMDSHELNVGAAQTAPAAAAASRYIDAYYHELWTCGRCGREFGECTSCVAHEQQCGGHLTRW